MNKALVNIFWSVLFQALVFRENNITVKMMPLFTQSGIAKLVFCLNEGLAYHVLGI